MILAMLVAWGCQTEPHLPPSLATPTRAPPAPVVTPTAVPTSATAACTTDSDCAVVYTLYGLTEIPADPAERLCQPRCFMALPAGDVAAWDEARTRLLPLIPCDKKMEECPALSSQRAVCEGGKCRVRSR